MNKKILMLIFVLTLTLLSTVPVMAARGRTGISFSLDMISEILTYQVTIPHPGGYREPVLVWLAVAVGLMLYFLFMGLTKKYVPFIEGESIEKGFALGLTLTAIFGAPVVEMISGLIGLLAAGTMVVGLIGVVVVVVLLFLALKGFWGKRSAEIEKMVADGMTQMAQNAKQTKKARKALQAARIWDENPEQKIEAGATNIPKIKVKEESLSGYAHAIANVIQGIPRFKTRILRSGAVTEIFRTNGKRLFESAEAKLSELQREFESKTDQISGIKELNKIEQTLKNKLQYDYLDPTQITKFNGELPKLKNSRDKITEYFDALLKHLKERVRSLAFQTNRSEIEDLYKEIFKLYDEAEGYLEGAEKWEEHSKDTYEAAGDVLDDVEDENNQKMVRMENFRRRSIKSNNTNGGQKKGQGYIPKTSRGAFVSWVLLRDPGSNNKRFIKFAKGVRGATINFNSFELNTKMKMTHLRDALNTLHDIKNQTPANVKTALDKVWADHNTHGIKG